MKWGFLVLDGLSQKPFRVLLKSGGIQRPRRLRISVDVFISLPQIEFRSIIFLISFVNRTISEGYLCPKTSSLYEERVSSKLYPIV